MHFTPGFFLKYITNFYSNLAFVLAQKQKNEETVITPAQDRSSVFFTLGGFRIVLPDPQT